MTAKAKCLNWSGDADTYSSAKWGSMLLVVEVSLRDDKDFAWGIADYKVHDDSEWHGHYKTMETAQRAAERWAFNESKRMLKSFGVKV